MFLCLSRAGWVSGSEAAVGVHSSFPWSRLCDVELWGGIGGDGGQAEAMDPWRKRGSNCEQTRRQSPQAHHPTTAPTARCNSTPEITITPWALSVPLLAHFPFAPGSLRRGGNTFTSMQGCVEALHSSAGAVNWLTHLHHLCFKALLPRSRPLVEKSTCATFRLRTERFAQLF